MWASRFLSFNGLRCGMWSSAENVQVATMFAVMKDTEYATKPKFIENFWADWQPILGNDHVIKDFEGCDFTPIYDWFAAEKEKKKSMSVEVSSFFCFTKCITNGLL